MDLMIEKNKITNMRIIEAFRQNKLNIYDQINV